MTVTELIEILQAAEKDSKIIIHIPGNISKYLAIKQVEVDQTAEGTLPPYSVIEARIN